MNKAVLGDEVNDAILLRDLQSNREIIAGFRGEENVDCLLREDGIRLGMVNLDNVQLRAHRSADGKGEKLRILGRAIQTNCAECGSMALDRLADAAVFGVQLHSTDNAALLLRDTDHDHPLAVGTGPVVYDLVTLRAVRIYQALHPTASPRT